MSFSRVFWVVPLLLFLAGCGSRNTNYLKPSESKARTALEAMLDAWKSGKKLGRIDSSKPTIDPYDVKWRSGQQLADYEILSVEPADGPVKCRVRLKMKSPPGTVEVNYYIVGSDPLNVFREEDWKSQAGG